LLIEVGIDVIESLEAGGSIIEVPPLGKLALKIT